MRLPGLPNERAVASLHFFIARTANYTGLPAGFPEEEEGVAQEQQEQGRHPHKPCTYDVELPSFETPVRTADFKCVDCVCLSVISSASIVCVCLSG